LSIYERKSLGMDAQNDLIIHLYTEKRVIVLLEIITVGGKGA